MCSVGSAAFTTARRLLVCTAILLAAIGSRHSGAVTIEGGIIRVHVSEGGKALAEETLAILQAGLAQYDARLPAGDTPIDIAIARTPAEFNALGAPAGMRRVEGFAVSRESRIVLKAPHLMRPDASYASVARHELLHVLLARNSEPGNLPRWLNEGIAMLISGEYRWSSMYRVASMYGRGRVIEYDALEFAFAAPGDEEEFGNAYAQSLSMTKYLRDRVGEAAFWELIAELKTAPFDEVLHRRLGLTEDDFVQGWEGSLWTVAVVSSLVSGFGAFQLAAVLALWAYVRKRRRGQRILRTWAAEEAEEPEIMFPWQLEDREGPHPWEEDSDD
jgi:hypothetical protein